MTKENIVNVVSGMNSSIDNTMLEAETKDRVILYFGGGLSSNKYIREQLGPLLLETTFHSSNIPNSYPIIAQWETGLFELDSIMSIVKELLGQDDINKIRNWLKRNLNIDAMGLTPVISEDKSARNILISVGFSDEDLASDDENLSDTEIVQRLEKLYTNEGSDLKEAFQAIDSRIMRKAPQGFLPISMIKVLYRILKRFVRKTNHGAYVTIVEELLRVTMHFTSSLADLAQGHWKQVYGTSERMWSEGPGQYLLEKLDNYCQKSNARRIDLVSHSAGSIAVCHLIKEIGQNRYPNIKIGHILPVAPAVTMKLFEDTIIKYSDNYNNFRMYTLTDQAELNDKLFSPIYTHSLLYFVSGVAEEEGQADMSILGMHRYFRSDGNGPYLNSRYKKKDYCQIFGNLEKIRKFLNQDNAVVLSPNNINPDSDPGLAADGTGHENTKLPNQSPELAKSLIYVLSDGAVLPKNVNTESWQKTYCKYHKC